MRHILEILEERGVEVEKVGQLYRGLCPFHKDKDTPNLFIYPDTNSYFCFVCDHGGSPVDFIMGYDDCSLREALKRARTVQPGLKMKLKKHAAQKETLEKSDFSDQVNLRISKLLHQAFKIKPAKEVLKLMKVLDKRLFQDKPLFYEEAKRMTEAFKDKLGLNNKKLRLETLNKTILNCKQCKLQETCDNILPGEGNANSSILFIGSCPKKDSPGILFGGMPGKVLDKLLEEISLTRDKVYITNILKCSKSYNKDPKPEEIKYCGRFLNEQINIIDPDIIVCLGIFATQYMLKKYLNLDIYKLHRVAGDVFSTKDFKIIPVFHPEEVLKDKDKLNKLKIDSKKIQVELNNI